MQWARYRKIIFQFKNVRTKTKLTLTNLPPCLKIVIFILFERQSDTWKETRTKRVLVYWCTHPNTHNKLRTGPGREPCNLGSLYGWCCLRSLGHHQLSSEDCTGRKLELETVRTQSHARWESICGPRAMLKMPIPTSFANLISENPLPPCCMLGTFRCYHFWLNWQITSEHVTKCSQLNSTWRNTETGYGTPVVIIPLEIVLGQRQLVHSSAYTSHLFSSLVIS